MKTPPWLTTAQKAAKKHALSLPLKAKYGLNMPAFFEHEITSTTHTPTFTWHGPEEIKLIPLSEALTKPLYQKYLEKHFNAYTSKARSASFNLAHSQDGIVIVIPTNFAEDRACSIKINLTTDTNLGHIIIVAEANSKLTLITETIGTTKSIYNLSAFVEENAHFNHIVIDEENANVHFSDHHYYVAAHSELFYLDTAKRNYQGERSIHTFLEGIKSKAYHYHLSVLAENAKYDLYTQITHQAASSNSAVFARAVLDDHSHMIYRGMITVQDQANNCFSEQKEATLMLSPQAKIDAVPMLNIINDQVQCSHSASMSNFDPEKLFYMATRGLTPSETKKMLIQSFIQTELSQLTDINLKTWIQDNLPKLLAL